MNRKLKVLDLFSGIGGFALGLDSTGFFETVKFVEKDKYCQKVLRKNFPNIPIEEDIKNVEGKEYSADVVVGGFPCQPFSVAGKQKGTNDDRYLWPEMLRLIREIKPEFVIGENVQGIINLQNGMVLRQVQDQLESEGFEVQCFLIPASGIGAWHQRYRVWIVGHSQHNGLLAAEKRCRDEKDYGGSQKREERNHRTYERQVDPETMKMYPTPRSSGQENPETLIKRKGMKAAAQHNLTAAVKMYPTPTVVCEEGGEQSHLVERTKSGGFVSRRKGSTPDNLRIETVGRNAVSREDVSDTKHEGLQGGQWNDKGEGRQILSPEQQKHQGRRYGVRLGRIDGVQREESRCYRHQQRANTNIDSRESYTQASKCLEAQARRHGGKLNPTFVEFLMGFPMNWTKTEPTESKPSETQSSHKSQGSSDSQSKKFYPTLWSS